VTPPGPEFVLRSLPVGTKFSWQDRFESGFVIDCRGEKIGETTERWDAVRFDRKALHNPSTGEWKWLWQGPGWSLMDSATPVTKLEGR
jgi:hypothetical protein